LLASGTCKVKADAPFIKTPQTARFIDSGTMLISVDNIGSYKDDLKKITNDIRTSIKAKYLDCK
jgi:ribose transport system substrate-binding protein